jgi:alanyl-tRNA synthetase
VINYAARKILGTHVHQWGSEKDVDKSRIDITHYASITKEELEKIENLANELVEKNVKIEKKVVQRMYAEKIYGFGIYQGGYVPSREVRIVAIGNYDIEACSGTHGNSTKDIGLIKITRCKRVADGLVRIEIKVAEQALQDLKQKEAILEEVAKKLNVSKEEVPQAIEALFKRWKKLRKRLRKKLG